AQCFPRLARPLHGAVLMQVQYRFSAKPVLAAHGQNWQHLCMQNHAPYAGIANIRIVQRAICLTIYHLV
ncbi:hypothetical protein P3T84_23380, partial [Escherichia coli]|nr:hypothetical protein [Escherichia coli]